MSKILILNGPPGIGKDTIARLMSYSRIGFKVRQFKEALFNIALAACGVSREAWFERYEDRDKKELPWGRIGCLSQREFLIKISEEWVKPVFGKQHFGGLSAISCQSAMADGSHVVFSDGGFTDEVRALCNAFGADNVKVIRLHREGFTFGKDSRSYLYPDFCESIDLTLVDDEPAEAAFWLCSYIGTICDTK